MSKVEKLAIIGASYLQRPLVKKANEMGLETHVFAWEDGNVVEDIADKFYPISVLEKDKILERCKDIGIDGITSIASDIAMPTVNYVADKLGLVGNSIETTRVTTDKFEMRKALDKGGIPCPKFTLFETPNFANENDFTFPVIVKPTDRSGSRGVTKVENIEKVNEAIDKALNCSMKGRVIVEEFIEGREFSVEMISYNGDHEFLAITDKVTTGEPYFVEIEHHQPAYISEGIKKIIIETIKKALDVLGITNGASHSEVLLTSNKEIRIVEITGRMGGDLIGSHLVPITTGFDFLKAIIQISLNKYQVINKFNKVMCAGVYYVLPKPGLIKKIIDYSSEIESVREVIPILQVGDLVHKVIDSADKRAGIIVYTDSENRVNLIPEEILEFQTI